MYVYLFIYLYMYIYIHIVPCAPLARRRSKSYVESLIAECGSTPNSETPRP